MRWWRGAASPRGALGPVVERPRALVLLLELGLVVLLAAAQRGLTVCESLLRALLGQRVNEVILEKALTLSLADFEDSEFYDSMTRARREASARPLSLVKRAFGLVQNAISVVVYAGLLVALSPWAVVVLAVAAVPVFVAETRFSADAFRLFRWRAPETRKQTYLETLLAREDHAKEVKLFGLGPLFLERYRAIFSRCSARTARSRCAAASGASASGCSARWRSTARTRWIVDARGAGRDHARRHDDVPAGVQAGAERRSPRSCLRSAACTRTTCISRTCTSSSATAAATAPGTKTAGPDPSDGIRFERRVVHLSRRERARARAT